MERGREANRRDRQVVESVAREKGMTRSRHINYRVSAGGDERRRYRRGHRLARTLNQ